MVGIVIVAAVAALIFAGGLHLRRDKAARRRMDARQARREKDQAIWEASQQAMRERRS